MLDDDNNGYISVPELLRIYLDLPKTSDFAGELLYIFRFFMENYIKFSEILKKKARFDIYDYKTIIPDSCVTRELYDRFIYRVKNNMIYEQEKPKSYFEELERGPQTNIKWIINYQGDSESVFFPREGVDLDDIFDEEIRDEALVFGERITEQNLEELC